jgi:transposase InsO family protein
VFTYIRQQPAGMNIKAMCEAYGVTTSGFYAWRGRQDSPRKCENRRLADKIRKIHQQSHGIYGSPRITAMLRRQGLTISENRVARIMQTYGIVGRIHTRKPRAPCGFDAVMRTSNKRLIAPPPTGVNQVWAGDVTYIRFQKRWWYLAVVMDIYSRKVIGWALDAHRRQDLTTHALRKALQYRQPAPTLLFHSDRGVEYAGGDYRQLLTEHQIEPSMNRPGHCTDNAHMESFFHSLKGEWIRENEYATVELLRQAIRDYIVNFYNRTRLHSSLNYCSPDEFERMNLH